MDRRAFLCGLALASWIATLAAEGQQAEKVARIGFLSPSSPSDAHGKPSDLAVLFEALRVTLRKQGYVEDQNIKIEWRWADGNYDRLPSLAADLVRLKVAIIVTYGTPASQAAKRATDTIPVVMAAIIDPVASGLVTSLARPGGNVTGQSMMSPDLAEKQLEILKEAIPKISRVAVLHNPDNPGNAPQVRHAQDAAQALRLRAQILGAKGPGELDSAFTAMHLTAPLDDIARFGYLTGSRKNEVVTLAWSNVDRTRGLITIAREHSKNAEPRVIPLTPALAAIIERRWKARTITRPEGTVLADLVFHRDGAPVGSFRKAWASAYKAAGPPGLLFHDLRRSAVRNFERAGVSQAVVMKITGHKTASVYRRYRIVDERDVREALTKTEVAIAAEQTATVVPLVRQA
jgi:ABC transporter substrate binding protein/Phage integrase family